MMLQHVHLRRVDRTAMKHEHDVTGHMMLYTHTHEDLGWGSWDDYRARSKRARRYPKDGRDHGYGGAAGNPEA